MKRLLQLVKPSIPTVGLLVEPPFAAALRVDKVGRMATAVTTHTDLLHRETGGTIAPEAFDRFCEEAFLRIGSPRRACMVLADTFFRSQILDISDFPRREAERSQVLKWHLRKNLDFPVDAARLQYIILRKTASSWTIWVTAARQEELSGLEGTLGARSCEIGHIGLSTVELFNLAYGRDMLGTQGATLLLNRGPSFLSFFFSVEGVPLFYRCKELPHDVSYEGSADRVEQEIRLTLAYFRERFGSSPLRRVLVRTAPDLPALPLEALLSDEEVFQMDAVLAAGQPGCTRSPGFLPLYGILEGH